VYSHDEKECSTAILEVVNIVILYGIKKLWLKILAYCESFRGDLSVFGLFVEHLVGLGERFHLVALDEYRIYLLSL
jgi:hypothetical protein